MIYCLQYKHEKIIVEKVPGDLIFCHFLSLEKTFFKVFAQFFGIGLCDCIGLEHFLLSFSQS